MNSAAPPGAKWTSTRPRGRSPGARTKTGDEHRVALSDRALEILEAARSLADRSGLIFPSTTGRQLSNNTIRKAAHRPRHPSGTARIPGQLPKLVRRHRRPPRGRRSRTRTRRHRRRRRLPAQRPTRPTTPRYGPMGHLHRNCRLVAGFVCTAPSNWPSTVTQRPPAEVKQADRGETRGTPEPPQNPVRFNNLIKRGFAPPSDSAASRTTASARSSTPANPTGTSSTASLPAEIRSAPNPVPVDLPLPSPGMPRDDLPSDLWPHHAGRGFDARRPTQRAAMFHVDTGHRQWGAEWRTTYLTHC